VGFKLLFFTELDIELEEGKITEVEREEADGL
jgi:hypothetical protein